MIQPESVPSIEFFDHQGRHGVDRRKLENFARRALAEAHSLPEAGDHPGPLKSIPCVEVSLVSDEEIARVHREFMQVAGATDVITFDHGEIVISADTAATAAAELGTSCEREIALYIVHGLLHLLGYDDKEPAEAAHMREMQEQILSSLWDAGDAC